MPRSLVAELRVRDLRSLRDLTIELGPVAALVGESLSGTSSLLMALRAVLVPGDPGLAAGDVRRGAAALHVSARLGWGGSATLAGRPPHLVRGPLPRRAPGCLFFDAVGRVGGGRARATVADLDRRAAAGLTDTVVLLEEPELQLAPQDQRYFARLLRRIAAQGNQVIYATRSPAFLNVARMEELVFVERSGPGGATTALRPPPLTPDDDFRVLSEFDAERAELFLARAALLVEGETEKLALPFVFAALGEDADREGISIVECGGKANLLLFARVCRAAGVPFAVLYDRDAWPGRRPSATDRRVHEELRALAGPGRAVELAPDFEAVARLHGAGHKPERAWRRFATLAPDRMPLELVRVARLAVALARDGGAARRGGQAV
jgi:hypothetical protein